MKMIKKMKATSLSNPTEFKRKLVSLCILFLLASYPIFGQGQGPISKGQLQLNGVVGFSSFGTPVSVGLDLGVHSNITIGGEASYRRYAESFLGSDFEYTIIGFYINGNYHFNKLLKIPSNFDLYAGLNIGFYNSDIVESGFDSFSSTDLGIGAQIGGRYYFSDNWGINLELGQYYANEARLGISHRF